MQLTANLAVLATAVAYSAPSVFALPVNIASSSLAARDVDYDLDAREVADFDIEAREVEELEFAARELIDEYYQSREVYDELDARGYSDDMEFEAREFLNYLGARDAPPTAPTPAAPAASPAAASPSATPSGTPATPASTPKDAGASSKDEPVKHEHHKEHMPQVLVDALTDTAHPMLQKYAKMQESIFHALVDLADGAPNAGGHTESPELKKLAKDILRLKRWHRHQLINHEKEHKASHPAAASPAASPVASPAASPAAGSSEKPKEGEHKPHHLRYKAKIEELKNNDPKGHHYVAKARLHRDRLQLLLKGPSGHHDGEYAAALESEKAWYERHLAKLAKHAIEHDFEMNSEHHKHHDGAEPAPSTGSPSPAAAAPSASASPAADKPKEEPKAKDAGAKTAQGLKRRAFSRRGYY